MRLVLFGTYDVQTHPRVQVLAEGFAALGDEVAEVNAPLGLDTSRRLRTLRRPWLAPVLVMRMLIAWVKLWWRARRAQRPDVVVVGYMGHFDVHLARRLWPGITVALDHLISLADTAVDRGVSSPWRVAALTAVDRAAVARADLAVVDTEAQRGLLEPPARARACVVAVGAPARWFVEPVARAEGRLRAVFFGLFTPLQGAPVIGEALGLLARAGSALEVTMIGRGQDLAVTRSLAAGFRGVTWLDWVDADALPGLVAAHDVCLGIFGTSPKALRVVPNKVFQGAAAGCAVVTSDTAPQREALDDAGILVPPGDAAALARVLGELAEDPERVWTARRAAAARAREAFRPDQVVAGLRARLVQERACR